MRTNSDVVQELVDTFEKKDAALLGRFFHSDVVFRNYGDREIQGRAGLQKMWESVFVHFEVVRFETVHQAQNGNVVLAEQIHHLGLPDRPVAPIMNLAVYEFVGPTIVAWRDYTNPVYANELLSRT